MSKPLISILTPFKNSSLFLTACLESIKNQNYTHWELIIVDDHSTDNSYDIVEKYASSDSRIQLYKNKGNGIIEALRLALEKSSGTYITRMDSDDIMLQEKLEVMLTQLKKAGTKHVALGLVKYFSATGIYDGYARYESWLNSLTITGNNYSEIYKECVIPSPCWMIHREDLLACDAFEPNLYPEDYDLAFRFYKNKIKCLPAKHILHYWRDYETRTSRTHIHYADNNFLDIKLKYFLELDHDPSRPLTLWGAGSKGKQLAKLLIKKDIPFTWICNNPKKIGKHIYNQELFSFKYLEDLQQPQCIVTVANGRSQLQIKSFFETQEMIAMSDYFFFC